MRRTTHGIFFNVVFATALLLIVGVFGVLAYVVANVDITTTSIGPSSVILAVGGAIGLMALATGVIYGLSNFVEYGPTIGDFGQGEDEVANYGAPRV